MFQEEFEEERFHGNRGRDAFIDQILNIPDPFTKEDKEEIAKLLDDYVKVSKHL
jgi:hypothetical protein